MCIRDSNNYVTLKNFLKKELPQIEVLRLEGTYLVWINIEALNIKAEALSKQLIKEAHVFINPGTLYSKKYGEGYLRINIATQRATMIEGLQRITKVIKKLL